MKIAVLLSGGVDSSVALAQLVRQGHQPTAFYIKIWLEDELHYLGNCPWHEDLSYATAVCKQLAVPLEIVSLQQTYWDEVVSYTVAEIKAGRTPNPDILCNKQVKFGAFLKRFGNEFDRIATGHYAQLDRSDTLVQLKTSPDPVKDQTYFLSQLSQEQLSKALFPVGCFTKTDTRALAHKFNLPTKDRKDSQGICFLGKIKFSDFVKHHVGTKNGPFIEYETGKNVGEHDGTWFYTIGQRHGIGLSGGPWYVVAKSLDDNTVFISRSYYAPDKQRLTAQVTNFNWISGHAPQPGPFFIKLRHGPEYVAGTLAFQIPINSPGDKPSCDNLRGIITLAKSDQGIAPGQFAAFYTDNTCLGSAVIE